MKRMFYRNRHKAKLTIYMKQCPRLPSLQGFYIGWMAARWQGFLHGPNKPQCHVVIARTHGTQFEKAPNIVQDFSRPAPSVSTVGVIVGAAVSFPKCGALRNNRLPRGVLPSERFMGLHVFVMGAKIVSIRPRLHHRVQLQGVNGFCCPITLPERNISVKGSYVGCIR